MPTIRKFETVFRGYDRFQVNRFVDEVIRQMEDLVKELDKAEDRISDLQKEIDRYKEQEETLNRAISTIEDSSKHFKRMAEQESKIIVEEARKNANRIVNDALMRAQKTEYEAANLRKNITVFKSRIRGIIESQLDIVEDLDNENI